MHQPGKIRALLVVAGLTGVMLPGVGWHARAGSIFDEDYKPPPSTPSPSEPKVPEAPETPMAPRLPTAPPVPSETVPSTPEHASAQAPMRWAVPPAGQLSKVDKLVKDVFSNEYKVHTPEGKTALAHALLNETRQNAQDPATMYVLFHEARDLAASAGDTPAALEASHGIRDWFAISDKAAADDERAVLSSVVQSLSAGQSNVAQRSAVRAGVITLMNGAEQCLADGDYAGAGKWAAQAVPLTRRMDDTSLVSRVNDRALVIQNIAAEHERAKPAFAVLTAKPDDPASCTAAGKFYATVADRPDLGMPYLARGSDAALKSLAARELSPPTDEAGLLALAASWSDAIKTAPVGPIREWMRHRAVYWYGRAEEQANGIEKIAVAKRADALVAIGMKRGLVGEYFRDTEFIAMAFTRVDPKLEFPWSGQKPDFEMPAENFAVRWTGFIKAPAAGAYELVVAHDDGCRIWIDGNLILDKWGDNGRATVTVQLTGAAQPIKIEFFQGAGDSYFGLGWVAPGSKKPVAVPPEALFHDDRPAAPVYTASTWRSGDGQIALLPAGAQIHNPLGGMRVTTGSSTDGRIGWWYSQSSWVTWDFVAPAGDYNVALTYACAGGTAGVTYVLSLGNGRLHGKTEDTGGWDSPHEQDVGIIHLTHGLQTARIVAIDKPQLAIMNFYKITLTPVVKTTK